MKVKCPKCRFRFEIPSVPGVAEVQCNCPRCGTPFVYSVEEEKGDTASRKKEQTGSESEAKRNVTEHKQVSETEPVLNDTTEDVSSNSRHDSEHTSGHSADNVGEHTEPLKLYKLGKPDTNDSSVRLKTKKWGGWYERLLFLGIIALLGIIFLISKCDHADINSNEVSESGDSLAEMSDSKPLSPFDAAAVSDGTPEWIKGTWSGKTDEGVISLTIDNDKIAESIDDKTSFGSYKLKDGKLYCSFGNNRASVYVLNKKDQCLYNSDGVALVKSD